MKEFVIVCAEDKDFKKKYKKTKTVESINHTEIINKLEGNDIYQAKPDNNVIKFFIISRINKAIKNNRIERIYYRVDEITVDIIEALNLIVNAYSNEVEVKIISEMEFDVKKIKDSFDKIEIL